MAFPQDYVAVSAGQTVLSADMNAIRKLLAGELWVNVAADSPAGNGTTNDATALGTTITAGASVDTVVNFGPKVYAVKTAATYTAALSAPGPLTLRGIPGKTTIKGDATSATGVILLACTGNDLTIEGITFDIPNVTDALGIFVAAATTLSRLTIRNCRFLTPKSGGIHIQGSVTNLLVEGCEFNGSGYGILIYEPPSGGRVRVIGNAFTGGSIGDAIEINAPTNGLADVVIANNIISGYTPSGANDGNGIGLARVSKATITGNVILGGKVGIHVEDASSDVTIQGNVIRGCTHAGIEVQFLSGKTIEDITIEGNIVRGCCTSPSASLGNGAIEASSGAAGLYGGTARAVNIIGNTCEDNDAAGIWTYESRQMLVSGNICRNNGGAGIDLTTPIESVITSNLSTDNGTNGLKLAGAATDAIVATNMLKGNTGASTSGTGIGETLANNIT